jgi:hypothetical protein
MWKWINCSDLSEVAEAKKQLAKLGYEKIEHSYHLDLHCYQVYGRLYY